MDTCLDIKSVGQLHGNLQHTRCPTRTVLQRHPNEIRSHYIIIVIIIIITIIITVVVVVVVVDDDIITAQKHHLNASSQLMVCFWRVFVCLFVLMYTPCDAQARVHNKSFPHEIQRIFAKDENFNFRLRQIVFIYLNFETDIGPFYHLAVHVCVRVRVRFIYIERNICQCFIPWHYHLTYNSP